MVDLNKMKWYRARVHFEPGHMRSSYSAPVFQATFAERPGPGQSVRMCIKCDNLFPLDPCPNCQYDGFVPGITSDHVAGLFCHKCDKGFSHWKCPTCGADNPISKSLAKRDSGGCFIATAVYGSKTSPEVLTLRSYRDDCLLANWFGRWLVILYYIISPQLATWLDTKKRLKTAIRLGFLDPIVNHINSRYYSG